MGPILEHYEILRLLGAGGMAVVYLARHRELQTLHAVKVLKHGSPRLAVRLRVEGELQHTLRHDNILHVTEVAEADDGPALILEYVAGPTLAAMLSDGPHLSLREVDALGRAVLAGVAAAHARGWVHRDLKPLNVLLARNDHELVPKIADFGVAKVLDDDGTADATSLTRLGLGTRRYMSLEQSAGAPAELRMDVFALGALLFELIERVPAFPTVSDWQASVRDGLGPALSRSGVPDRMHHAVAAALSGRQERPADAAALLALWAGDEPAPERPFRPETLRAAAWCGAHLTEEQLGGTLDPAAEAHIAACPRCRVMARLVNQQDSGATVDEG